MKMLRILAYCKDNTTGEMLYCCSMLIVVLFCRIVKTILLATMLYCCSLLYCWCWPLWVLSTNVSQTQDTPDTVTPDPGRLISWININFGRSSHKINKYKNHLLKHQRSNLGLPTAVKSTIDLQTEERHDFIRNENSEKSWSPEPIKRLVSD